MSVRHLSARSRKRHDGGGPNRIPRRAAACQIGRALFEAPCVLVLHADVVGECQCDICRRVQGSGTTEEDPIEFRDAPQPARSEELCSKLRAFLFFTLM